MNRSNTINTPPKAAQLGYAGLLPFIAALLLIAFAGPEPARLGMQAFVVYGAVILSFLGGIRWGAATTTTTNLGRALAVSVLPSLWAAVVLLLPSFELSAWGLMTGFAVLGLADWFFPGPRVASWMRPLRARLTTAVVVCHMAALLMASSI